MSQIHSGKDAAIRKMHVGETPGGIAFVAGHAHALAAKGTYVGQ